MSFSTNPYNNYYAPNSKEFISLDKGAKQDFHPETRFDLIPGNSDLFSAEIEKFAIQFGYGSLLNVPTNRDTDATDANSFAYKDHVNMIETWNKINDDIISRNANETWGTRNWSIPTTTIIEDMSPARGEFNTGATSSTFNKLGKKKFMERWKSTILSHQVMALLTPDAQTAIKIHKKAYQWTDSISDEVIVDGRLLLNIVLKLMRPDVQTNVYAELAKIKSIKPVDFGNNIVKWHSAMESKRISIEQKVPGSYHESQYIMDYLDASLTVEVKSFKAEVSIIRNRYLRGNPDKWDASYISGEIVKTYNNMFEDGTWQREIGEKDQIIALSTKITELQSKLEQQVISFATQMKSNNNKGPSIASSAPEGGSRRSKRDPYTVAPWRLIKKEDTVTVNGKDYHWCTGDHYSGGVKHNGMYADHKSSEHDSWRARLDERRVSRNNNKGEKSTAEKPSTEASSQKLVLNDKLRNASCTQAGLSAEVIDRILEEAQGNE